MIAGKDGERRHAIMRAAEELFARGRIHEITLDQVARRARVGKGTIYRHFNDKDDLFFQTATSGFEDLCALLRRGVPIDAPFAEQLLSACRQTIDFFATRRQLFRMMEVEQGRIEPGHPSLRELWLEKRRGLVDAVASILMQGQRAGEVRDDVPADLLAIFLLGMLRTRARDLADAPDAHRSLALLLDLFLEGSRPPREATAKPTGDP